MRSELSPQSDVPSKKERISLAALMEQHANEPSALDNVLRAADWLKGQIDHAESLERAMDIDPETGCSTKRGFMKGVESWASREGADLETPIVLIALDMNGVKRINDQYGHLAGDKYIHDTANWFKSVAESDLREGDLWTVSRVNGTGDEFFMALPAREAEELRADTKSGNATDVVVDKVNTLIQRTNQDGSYALGYIVASRGEILDIGIETLMDMADQEMYENKRLMKDGKQIQPVE